LHQPETGILGKDVHEGLTMSKLNEIREAAEADLETFIRLVAPHRVIGSVHSEWCRWTTSEQAGKFQLTLMPRDHGKSAYVAYKAAWWITKHPDTRILYVSSTSGLAEAQLKSIKDILTSSIYRRYWPEMVNAEEGKREKWTNTAIAVDHPKRKEEGIRDPTVWAAGLTTSVTGFHCDVAIFDDIVVYDNAYTDDGREKVRTQYSFFNSIEGTDSEEWVVGTRYHPKDLYSSMQEMEEEIFSDDGEIIDKVPVYQIFERQVEDAGDGTGQFIWPRQQRADGKWFGFDTKILATKRAKYLDKMQFRAQYYNDPNDPGDLKIGRDKFQYYEPKFLTNEYGTWFYKDRKLNVFASVDFAYSVGKRSDYTAIAVIGVDRENMVYVLDLDRFRTERISDYFNHILNLHKKWGFRKLGAEVTSAQKAIVRELKESYIRPHGLYLSIEELTHSRHQGSKEERMASILEPRYDNLGVWHYRGGNCQVLEEELIAQNPPHDDCMDALAAAISISVAPTGHLSKDRGKSSSNILQFNTRFGGIAA
jgi:phage terminase large subunit-like protein